MTETCRSRHLLKKNGDGDTDRDGKRRSLLSIGTVIVGSFGILIFSMVIYFVLTDHESAGIDKIDQERNPRHRTNVGLSDQPARKGSKRENFVDIIESKTVIHQFNRRLLLPLIKSLVTLDYFRYVKVNLNRPCKLWCNADKCNLRDCKVKTLSNPKECPLSSYDDSNQPNDNINDEGSINKGNELAIVNTELASDQLDFLIKLFECNDNDDHDLQYVDLLKNPERFTGYSGESAHRIWRAIYDENCFLRRDSRSPFSDEMCYEERLFYESISGLHSSINIHLCAEYPSNAAFGTFEPNVGEFLRRFDGRPQYLENLYKLYQLELKALSISKPYLLKRMNWPDISTKNAVHDLLSVVDKLDIPSSFDMSLKPSHNSHELAIHFRNITTTIIDCVACDKCKLWGKVQLRGLGTAFKILSVSDLDKLYLNHQEFASLVNAIARLSHSIRQLEEFKRLVLSTNDYKSNNLGSNLFK